MMKVKGTGLLLVISLSIALASPVENNASVTIGRDTTANTIEQMIIDFIEEIREVMKNGSDDIPVLDPFEIDHLHLELDSLGLVDSYITVDEIKASQLSTFVIEHVTVSMTSLLLQRYSVEVEGYVPALESTVGKYDMHVMFMGGRIHGNGEGKMRVVEPRIKARIDVGLSILQSAIVIRDANVVFTLKSFESGMTGMFGNDFLNEFINDFLSIWIPELVEFYQDTISNYINSVIMAIDPIPITIT